VRSACFFSPCAFNVPLYVPPPAPDPLVSQELFLAQHLTPRVDFSNSPLSRFERISRLPLIASCRNPLQTHSYFATETAWLSFDLLSLCLRILTNLLETEGPRHSAALFLYFCVFGPQPRSLVFFLDTHHQGPRLLFRARVDEIVLARSSRPPSDD